MVSLSVRRLWHCVRLQSRVTSSDTTDKSWIIAFLLFFFFFFFIKFLFIHLFIYLFMYLFFTFSPLWLSILVLFFIGLIVVCVCVLLIWSFIFFFFLPLFVYFMCSFHFISSAGQKLRSITLEFYINVWAWVWNWLQLKIYLLFCIFYIYIYIYIYIFIYILTNLLLFFYIYLFIYWLIYYNFSESLLCMYISLCNIFTIHICLLLMCCYHYVVTCFSVCDCNLNVYVWGPQTMRAHSSLRFIFLGIRKKK